VLLHHSKSIRQTNGYEHASTSFAAKYEAPVQAVNEVVVLIRVLGLKAVQERIGIALHRSVLADNPTHLSLTRRPNSFVCTLTTRNMRTKSMRAHKRAQAQTHTRTPCECIETESPSLVPPLARANAHTDEHTCTLTLVYSPTNFVAGQELCIPPPDCRHVQNGLQVVFNAEQVPVLRHTICLHAYVGTCKASHRTHCAFCLKMLQNILPMGSGHKHHLDT
jgi:hypothetical protein